jgi:hypothetical protein
LVSGGEDLAAAIRRIEVSRERVVVQLIVPVARRLMVEQLPPSDRLELHEGGATLVILTRLTWRGGAKRAVAPPGAVAIEAPRLDRALTKALVRAEAWKAHMLGDSATTAAALAAAEGVTQQYVHNLLPLAFLAPDLKRAILEGRTPAGLSLQALVKGDGALAWGDQRAAWRALE